ncbi:hypothetical protein Trydic_g2748 [Trypoxylus dichotomus]
MRLVLRIFRTNGEDLEVFLDKLNANSLEKTAVSENPILTTAITQMISGATKNRTETVTCQEVKEEENARKSRMKTSRIKDSRTIDLKKAKSPAIYSRTQSTGNTPLISHLAIYLRRMFISDNPFPFPTSLKLDLDQCPNGKRYDRSYR